MTCSASAVFERCIRDRNKDDAVGQSLFRRDSRSGFQVLCGGLPATKSHESAITQNIPKSILIISNSAFFLPKLCSKVLLLLAIARELTACCKTVAFFLGVRGCLERETPLELLHRQIHSRFFCQVPLCFREHCGALGQLAGRFGHSDRSSAVDCIGIQWHPMVPACIRREEISISVT